MTDLEAYSPEYEGLFAGLHQRARAGQGPSNEEILCVLKWKLARIKDDHFRVVQGNGDQIRRSIVMAGEPYRDKQKEAVRSLIGIPEIKLAVASALLTACWPDYSVLDSRVLVQLEKAGCHIPPWPTESADWACDVDGYFDRYLPAVERFRVQKGLGSLREADRTLWGRSVRKQILEGLGLD